jgi:hypothetical protein
MLQGGYQSDLVFAMFYDYEFIIEVEEEARNMV